jgi:hypothetical protein
VNVGKEEEGERERERERERESREREEGGGREGGLGSRIYCKHVNYDT